MKKFILGFTFILVCAFAFAFGYRNTYWGENFHDMMTESGKTDHFDWNDLVIFRENARMLGQGTTVYYILEKNKLTGICYSVKDTESSRKELDKLFTTRKLKLVEKRYINFSERGLTEEQEKKIDELLKEHIKEQNYFDVSYIVIDEIQAYYSGGKTLFEDAVIDKKTKREVYIADYDIDTRVLIYAGVIPDKILVGYVQKQDEF